MLSVVSRFVRCTAVSLMGSSLLLLSPSQSLAQSSSPAPLSDSTNPTRTTLPLVSSASQIDYSPLQAELKAGDFYDANETTRRLLYEAAGREDQGWLTPESIKAIPCQDLKIMDSLWRQYSNNRFGFSVQYNIFQQTGNRPGILRSTDAYEAFGEAIGWRHDSPEGEGREWTAIHRRRIRGPRPARSHVVPKVRRCRARMYIRSRSAPRIRPESLPR